MKTAAILMSLLLSSAAFAQDEPGMAVLKLYRGNNIVSRDGKRVLKVYCSSGIESGIAMSRTNRYIDRFSAVIDALPGISPEDQNNFQFVGRKPAIECLSANWELQDANQKALALSPPFQVVEDENILPVATYATYLDSYSFTPGSTSDFIKFTAEFIDQKIYYQNQSAPGKIVTSKKEFDQILKNLRLELLK